MSANGPAETSSSTAASGPHMRISLYRNDQSITVTSETHDAVAVVEPSFGPDDLRQFLVAIAHFGADDQAQSNRVAKELGIEISNVLFAGDVGRQLRVARHSLAEGEVLELALTVPVNDDFLLAIPWELAYEPAETGFLALSEDVQFTRSPLVQNPRSVPRPARRPRVMFLGASPSDRTKIDVRAQASEVRSALRATSPRAEFVEVKPPTYERLQEHLDEAKNVDVLHIAAHGSSDGPVLDLEDGTDDAAADSVSVAALASLIGRRDDVPLVVLNACEGSAESFVPLTSMADELLRQGTQFVVANQFEVPISVASTFNEAFYRSLGDGRSVGEAMTDGREALEKPHGVAQVATPTLHVHEGGASHHPIVRHPPWKRRSQTWSDWFDDLDKRSLVSAGSLLLAVMVACIGLLPDIPGMPQGPSLWILAGSLVIAAATTIGVASLVESWPPRPLREHQFVTLLCSAGVVVATILGLLWVDTDAPWWDGLDTDHTIVAVGVPGTTTDEEHRQAEGTQRRLVETINEIDNDRLVAVVVDEELDAGNIGSWHAAQGIDADIVIGGTIVQNPSTKDSFNTEMVVLAAAATRPQIVPLAIDETVAGVVSVPNVADKVVVDSRLQAIAELANGIALLSEDKLELAAASFDAAQRAFTDSSSDAGQDAEINEGSPLIAALSGFVEVVRASQTGDRRGVEDAAMRLRGFPNRELSVLATSTLWSLDYLALLPADGPVAETNGVGPCVPAAPNLPTVEATDALRRILLNHLATSQPSPLLDANARALLYRIELIRQFNLPLDEVDLTEARSILEGQLAAVAGRPELGLRLWESDAQASLADLERFTNPLEAIALLQRSQERSSPFYQQAARAAIGHIVECDFAFETGGLLNDMTTADSFVLYGIELPVLRRAAACYYESVADNLPRYPLEDIRTDLGQTCDSDFEAVPLLCLFEAVKASVAEDPALLQSIRSSEVLYRSGLGDPDLQCDIT